MCFIFNVIARKKEIQKIAQYSCLVKPRCSHKKIGVSFYHVYNLSIETDKKNWQVEKICNRSLIYRKIKRNNVRNLISFFLPVSLPSLSSCILWDPLSSSLVEQRWRTANRRAVAGGSSPRFARVWVVGEKPGAAQRIAPRLVVRVGGVGWWLLARTAAVKGPRERMRFACPLTRALACGYVYPSLFRYALSLFLPFLASC